MSLLETGLSRSSETSTILVTTSGKCDLNALLRFSRMQTTLYFQKRVSKDIPACSEMTKT